MRALGARLGDGGGGRVGAGGGTCRGRRVDLRVELRAPEVVVIVVAEQRARLRVQRRLWVGHDEQALDGEQHVLQSQLRAPRALQRVHADLARRRHVGMEYLGEEVGARRTGWKLPAQTYAHREQPALVRGVHWNKLHQHQITLIVIDYWEQGLLKGRLKGLSVDRLKSLIKQFYE